MCDRGSGREETENGTLFGYEFCLLESLSLWRSLWRSRRARRSRLRSSISSGVRPSLVNSGHGRFTTCSAAEGRAVRLVDEAGSSTAIF